jgi:sugar lactone lactonase YvrE
VGRIGSAAFVIGSVGLALLATDVLGGAPGEASASRIPPRPLFFERNDGQAGVEALYLARGRGYRLALSTNHAVLTLPGAPESPVRIRFEGAEREPRVVGVEELPGKVYYSPARTKGSPVGHATFRRVRYEGVYDGIDVVYYGRDGELEFDLEVAPDRDPSRIWLSLEGATELAVAPSGDLTFRAGGQPVTLRRPRLYQERDGVRLEVKGAYRLGAGTRVGFALGDYDRSQPLLVDPIFSFDTAGEDIVRGVEVNDAGHVYLLGETSDSSGWPWDEVEPGSKPTQCYLATMDPGSSNVLYTILFSGTDMCSALALSPSGVAYFPGYESPVTRNLHVTTLLSVDDTLGTPIVQRVQVNNYNPFLRQVGAIAADINDKIYLLGTCRVVSPGEPPLDLLGFNDAPDAGSGQPTCEMGASNQHVLLTKVARDGTVEYATFLASDDIQDAAAGGLAVDDNERVFVVRPRSAAVPVTPDAFRDACPESDCGYMMMIDTTQTAPGSLQYASYLWQMSGLSAISERQVVRLGAPNSVFLAWGGQIEPAFPETNFDPYPDVPRPLDPTTGVPVSQGIQLVRFDFSDLGAPNELRYARVAVGDVLPGGSERLVDLRILPSGAAVVGALLAPDPTATGLPHQSDFRTYYRSGVNAFRGNDTSYTMYPSASGGAPNFAMAFTPSGQRVVAQELSAASGPGPSGIRVDVASQSLDPGPNTPAMIVISPRQATVETYDPTGAFVPGYLAAFDWDDDAGATIGIGANCTHTYNITRFPAGTTHAVCTAMDDGGTTVTEEYDVTVNVAINTTTANTPISLVDVSVPASSVNTPGSVAVTFLGSVDPNGPGLTWLRTRVDQKPIGPPAGFQLGSSPFYYDIGTTADTTGPVRVCVDFTGMSFAVPGGVRLYHLAGLVWNDVTNSVDLNGHQICTVAPDANELGTFAIFTPADERTRVEILAGVGIVAGPAPPGDGGPSTSAYLASPTAVAFDLPRNAMYVADGRQVRRVDLASGIVTRYAGLDPTTPPSDIFGNPVEGGVATETAFMQIDDVAVDREGNLFLAQAQSCVIQRIDRVTGIVRNVAGAWAGDQAGSCGNTGDGGAARSATISLPARMAFDGQGNLFFDQSSGLPQQVFIGTPGFIRRIAAGADGLIRGRVEETITTIAGNGNADPVPGASPLASGMSPGALAFGSAGELFVGSYDRVLRVNPAPGSAVLTGLPLENLQVVAGGDPVASLPFGGDQASPRDADLVLMSDLEVLPGRELLVAHWNTKRIRVITPGLDGQVDGSADERITTLAGFEPQLPPGPLDLSDFPPTGYALSTLFFPGSVSLDPRGGIVVADSIRHYVRRFGYRAQGLSLSTLSIDFGPQTIGTASAPRTISVTNDARDPIAVTMVTLSGAFTQNSPACQTLAPGASCTIDVVFTPGAVGPLAGELQIADSTLAVHRVILNGVGRGIPAVSLTPSSLTFAAQLVGTTSPPQTVTLANTGNGNLTVSGIAIVGADFAHTTSCPAVLGPLQSCAIDVVLRPLTEGGLRRGELRVATDAAGSPHVVTLTGFGDTRRLSISPPVVDFGPVSVGAASAPAAVTLTNAGSLPLTLNGLQVVGATSAGMIDTFAGTGVPSSTPWRDGFPARTEPIGSPTAIAVDGRGNVFFATWPTEQVVRVDGATRTLSTIWTPGSTAHVVDGGGGLGAPVALAIDRSGNLYVAEVRSWTYSGGNRVRRVDAVTGAIEVVAGNGLEASTGDGGSALAASFVPNAIAIDGPGNLFITDVYRPLGGSSNPTVRRVDAETGIISRVAGGGVLGAPPDGSSGGPATSAYLDDPVALAADAAGDIFILADSGLGPSLRHVLRVDAAAGAIRVFGDRTLEASLTASGRPALAVDALGNVIATEPWRVVRFDGRSGASSFIGDLYFSGSGPLGDGGPAASARLDRVGGIAVDDSGNLYFSQTNEYRVRRVEAFTSVGSALFPATGDCGTALAIGASCSLSVRFQASLPGPQRAEIEVASDASGAPHRVALTGAGARPQVLVSPAQLTFADRAVGTRSQEARVIVANSGNGALELTSLQLAGADSGDFALSHGCPITGSIVRSLAPGAACSASIAFTPQSPGPRAAELHVSPAATVSPAVVPLSGAGAVASLSLSPTSLDFGALPVNAPRTLPVTVTNTGTALVSFTQMLVSGSHASDFEASGCSGDLASGASCTILVTFRAQGVGARSAELLVVRMGPGWLGLGLQGTGSILSAISVSPPTIDFGTVAVGGAPGERTATITNDGTAPVAITDVSISGQITFPGTVRTLAGDGAAGVGPDGVPAIAAHLGDVYDVAVDAAGNQYLADASLHRVWRIDAVTGRIATFAGSGTPGYLGDGGPAIAARLDTPTSVAVDGLGRVYIADTGNHVVRRVGPTGLIETFAGNGSPGYAGDNGPATSASLASPQGLAFDRSGALLVAEALNHVIRRIASDGTITSLVGDGIAGSGQGGSEPLRLHAPVDVAVSPAGDLAIADGGNARVLWIERPESLDRRVSRVPMGSIGGGGVAFDSIGRVILSEPQAHRLWRLDPINPADPSAPYPILLAGAGTGQGQSGWQDAGTASAARFSSPRGLAVDVAGHTLIADTGNHRLRQLDGASTDTGTEFTATANCVGTLPPQASCEADLAFAPGSPGLHRATLALTHDAAAGPRSLDLGGFAAQPFGYLTPRSASFDGVEVGSTVIRSMRLINSGNGPLQFGGLNITGADTAPFSATSNCPATLSPGLGCEIEVAFAPTTVGFLQATLEVIHDGVPPQDPYRLVARSVPARTETSLTSPTNGSVFGEPVTLSVLVTSPFRTPGGTVSFTDCGAATPILPDAPLSGGAGSLIADALPAGTHALQAHYGGDPLNATSSSPSLLLTVAKQTTSTALTTDRTSPIYGQTLNVTAGVASPTGGPLTGAMRFFDGGSPIDPPVPLVLGSASLLITASAGPHSYTGEYLGDANSEASSSAPVAVSVAQAATTTTVITSRNPAHVNFPVSFTATVTPLYGGAVSGSVTFRNGTTVIGVAPIVGNQATLSTTFTAFQTASLTAAYGGDGNLLASTSDRVLLPVQRVPTTMTVTSSPNPSFVGQAVTITVTVSSPEGPPPDGQQVRLFGVAGVVPILNLAGGTATYVTSTLAAGTRIVTALYAGNLTFTAGSASLLHVVNRYTTSLSLTSSANPSTFGAPVTFTATVDSPGGPPPDGQLITFVIQNVGTATRPLSGGIAAFTTSLRAGTTSVRASYGGDAAFTPSTSQNLSQVVSPAATTVVLTSSQNPSSVGTRVTFTAVVTSPAGTPTGTVTFRRGTVVLGTSVLNAGRAALQTTSLPRGSWTVSATYNPVPANFATSVGTVVQVVN